MERPAFAPREFSQPPGFGLADSKENAADDRTSYRAVELVRAAAKPGGMLMFVCRWQERLAHGGGFMPRQKQIPYFHIGDIDVTGDEHLSLITTYSLIHLEGRNLLGVAAELGRLRVEALQEFDAGRWDEPSPDQPIIQRMWVESRSAGR